jgi:hypothetical protein
MTSNTAEAERGRRCASTKPRARRSAQVDRHHRGCAADGIAAATCGFCAETCCSKSHEAERCTKVFGGTPAANPWISASALDPTPTPPAAPSADPNLQAQVFDFAGGRHPHSANTAAPSEAPSVGAANRLSRRCGQSQRISAKAEATLTPFVLAPHKRKLRINRSFLRGHGDPCEASPVGGVAARRTRGDAVGVHGSRRATFRFIGISGARHSDRRLSGSGPGIYGLRLTHRRLTRLGFRFGHS